MRLLSWGPCGRLSQKEEDICKAFARELLMPRQQIVQAETESAGMTGMALLSHLAARFEVSEEFATVRLMWDLADLDTSVAIFGESGQNGTGNTFSLRRYFGKSVRSLRRREKVVLESVSEALIGGSMNQRLSEIAFENQEYVRLEWKRVVSEAHQRATAFLDFYR